MRDHVTAIGLSLGAALLPAAARAQGPRLHWQPVHATAHWHGTPRATSRPAIDTTRIPSTYWLEGALIGGGALGVLAASTGLELCHYDGPCHAPVAAAVGGFVLGGLIGSGVGALIGGQIPKHHP
jgi:hypothetical protein